MPIARTLACAAALLVASAPVAADEIYLTLGAANGSFEADAPAGCTLDSKSSRATGATAGIGFAFDAHYAVEFGYLGLGGLDLEGSCPPVTNVTINAPDSGLQVSAVGRWAFDSRWAALGRLGAFSWSEAAASGTETVLGLGGEYSWQPHWAVRLEYLALGSDLDALALTLRIGF